MRSYLKLPGPKMIFVPGGKHKVDACLVEVRDFWMDETPVTVAQYREAVIAGAVSHPEKEVNSNYYLKGREDHPINCVSWLQASAYAKWAGKRLPTADEWEWAARGGDEGRRYPWGGRSAPPPRDQLCWNGEGNDLGEGNRKSTSPVGLYPKGNSKHGIKDLFGNVREWVVDTLDISRVDRVVCGHISWKYTQVNITDYAYLYLYDIQAKIDDVGFRCVNDAKVPFEAKVLCDFFDPY